MSPAPLPHAAEVVTARVSLDLQYPGYSAALLRSFHPHLFHPAHLQAPSQHEDCPVLYTMNRTLTPQAKVILAHLRRVGSITNVEANAVHRVRSLSRRITEIQDAGHPVEKVFKKDATGQRYVRYSLRSAA